MMAGAVYLLCIVTSALCAYLLFRAHQRTKRRFLLWSALCFLFLMVNNVLVLLDLLVLPDGTLVAYRQFTALLAVGVMIYGFMWEVD
jgi:hypothetical protein